MQTKEDTLHSIGADAYAAIAEMVSALHCDYDRMQELRDERDGYDSGDTGESWEQANPDDAAELTELENAAGECASEDEARERIEQDALSVEVRSDWQSVGETLEPTEFCILLATGGPAVRIVGDLDNGSPSRPRLQVQDWGTPWTEYFAIDISTLLAYCECFYFGD